MSIYRSFSKSNVFNTSDIISQQETQNGSANITLDLSSFMSVNNPVLHKSMFIPDPTQGLNFQGITQKKPYSQQEIDKVENAKNDLTNITFVNNITEITGDLDLTESSILFSDESIEINKITNLLSTLEGIQENVLQIHANDNDILNLQTENLFQMLS